MRWRQSRAGTASFSPRPSAANTERNRNRSLANNSTDGHTVYSRNPECNANAHCERCERFGRSIAYESVDQRENTGNLRDSRSDGQNGRRIIVEVSDDQAVDRRQGGGCQHKELCEPFISEEK